MVANLLCIFRSSTDFRIDAYILIYYMLKHTTLHNIAKLYLTTYNE